MLRIYPKIRTCRHWEFAIKTAQTQQVLPYHDISYYTSFLENDAQKVPDADGRWRCALCNEEVENIVRVNYWSDRDKEGNVFSSESIGINIDQNIISEEIAKLMNEYRQILNNYLLRLEQMHEQTYSEQNLDDSEIQNKQVCGDFYSDLSNALSASPLYPYTNSHIYISLMPATKGYYTTYKGVFDRINELDGMRDNTANLIAINFSKFKVKQLKPICDDCEKWEISFCSKCGDEIIPGRDDIHELDEIYCEECYDDLPNCESCSEKVENEKEAMHFTSDMTLNGFEGWVCDKCKDRMEMTCCDNCGRCVVGGDDYGQYVQFIHDGIYCYDCKKAVEAIEYSDYQALMSKENLDLSEMLPISSADIVKTYLPFFDAAMKKFPDSPIHPQIILDFAKKRNLKGEYLSYIKLLLEQHENIQQIIDYLTRIDNAQKEFANKYPGLKNIKMIPCRFDIEESYGEPDVPSMTFTMSPSSLLKNFGDAMCPYARDMLTKLVNNRGHHYGNIAYCRVSEEDYGNWIIDNLQTDADILALSENTREKIKEIQEGYVTKKDGQWYRKEDSAPINLSYPDNTAYDEALALAFWNKTFRHWPMVMLDMVITLAKAAGKSLYITSYEMQKQKWTRIPERSRDLYERIPQQMGGERVKEFLTPQDLGEGRYNVIQLAHLEKEAVGANLINRVKSQYKLSTLQAETFIYWYLTTGGTPRGLVSDLENKSIEQIVTNSNWQARY